MRVVLAMVLSLVTSVFVVTIIRAAFFSLDGGTTDAESAGGLLVWGLTWIYLQRGSTSARDVFARGCRTGSFLWLAAIPLTLPYFVPKVLSGVAGYSAGIAIISVILELGLWIGFDVLMFFVCRFLRSKALKSSPRSAEAHS